MICCVSVAPMPPYSFGQWGAIQPRSQSLRCQGLSSGGSMRVDRLHRSTGRFSPIHSRTSWRKARSAGSSSTNSVVLSQVGNGMRSGPQRRTAVAEHDLVACGHPALERDVLTLLPDLGPDGLTGEDRPRKPRLDAV